MKVSFFRRLAAYLVDFLIVVVLISIVTFSFKGSEVNNRQLNELMTKYSSGEITVDEYTNSLYEIEYQNQKNNTYYNIVCIVIYVGYYMIFATLNKGQTLGKKLFKLKVTNKEGKKPKFINMFIRGLCIYRILGLVFGIIICNFFNIRVFKIGYPIISYIEILMIIISFFMIIYKKDGRGLHDILAKTIVVNEVKK